MQTAVNAFEAVPASKRFRRLPDRACAIERIETHFLFPSPSHLNRSFMRRRIVLPAFLALLAAPLLAQQPSPPSSAPIDWDAVRNETVDKMRQYFRINTTNPPGNELQTALWLKDVLEKEGFET